MFKFSFQQKDDKDTSNFDKDFTSEEPVLTPIDPIIVKAINQDEFRDFSFVNSDWRVALNAKDSPAPNNNTKSSNQQKIDATTTAAITPSLCFPQPLSPGSPNISPSNSSNSLLQNNTTTSANLQSSPSSVIHSSSNTSINLNASSSPNNPTPSPVFATEPTSITTTTATNIQNTDV